MKFGMCLLYVPSVIMEGPQGSSSVFNVGHGAKGMDIAEVTAVTGILVNQHLFYCHNKPVHLQAETIEKQNISAGDRINVSLKVCEGSGKENKQL